MAEAFARAYGADVIIPASAGLAPAFDIAPDTMRAMFDKGLDLRDHFPKSVRQLGRARFDLVVNMSGEPLPVETGARVVEWEIADPVRMKYNQHCKVRDQIERRIMELILELRREQHAPSPLRGQGSAQPA
jgi:arsenate reductase